MYLGSQIKGLVERFECARTIALGFFLFRYLLLLLLLLSLLLYYYYYSY